MTTPSKAAMDAAIKWLGTDNRMAVAHSLAKAFDAFAASQSAALLEALEEVVAAPEEANSLAHFTALAEQQRGEK
jgi:hypothetical protein